MAVIETTLDLAGPNSRANRDAMLARVESLDSLLSEARSGGGQKYVERHHARGKLLPRERISLLVDRDSPFLELMPVAAAHSDFNVGGSIVTGIGVVEGVECMLYAHDPTVRGGAHNPYTLRKGLRAQVIARENRLPLINLVESGGADLPTQAEIFVPGGETFRNLSRLSAAGIPTLALVFGNATAGGAYVPGMCDYTVLVQDRAKVFLGGPPLVRMATGEVSNDEELGGAEMHARTSGLADYMALDEHDAIRVGRNIISRLNWQKLGPPPSGPPTEPMYPAEDLLAIPSADPRSPFDPREVIARIVDGSEYDEFKPLYGNSLTTGWASIHGYPIGILANVRGVLFSQEAQKGAQFIQLANQSDIPLLFMHNTTGFMVGRDYEQGGITKHGALMINAVANSSVPHLGLMIGSSYGAGNYAMSGRAYRPRFLFAWPNARTAVMGPQQLAGVISIVARAAAEARGEAFDEDEHALRRTSIEEQITNESRAIENSGRLYDDGIIDPRDTRTVLGFALSACHSNTVAGALHFGVFRM